MPVQEENISGLIVADRIRELMKGKGITQVQLAKAIGVSQPAVSGWLRGAAPDVVKLARIASFFGIAIESFWTNVNREGLSHESRPVVAQPAAVPQHAQIDTAQLISTIDRMQRDLDAVRAAVRKLMERKAGG